MTALLSSAVLTAGMGLRLAKTKKVMPAGMLTAAGLLASTLTISRNIRSGLA